MASSRARRNRRRNLRYQWDRLHDARRASVNRRLRRVFLRIVNSIVCRYESRGILVPDPLDLLHRGELANAGNPVMVPQWRALISSGIQFEHDWIIEAEPSKRQQSIVATLELFAGMERQELTATLEEVPPSIYVELPADMKYAVDSWIASRRVGFWNKLETVFLSKIQKVIADGIKEGDTLKKFRQRLQSEMTDLSRYAAERIARTETTGAMNYGSQLERSELDIEEKEWVATKDIRTRTLINSGYEHLGADGDVVKNGDFFIVSGEKLLYPGDGDHGATAGNVINCRCAAVASIDYNANKRPAAAPVAPAPPVEKPTEQRTLVFNSFEEERDHPDTKFRIDFYKQRSAELEKETEAIRSKLVSKSENRIKSGEKKLRKIKEEWSQISAELETMEKFNFSPDHQLVIEARQRRNKAMLEYEKANDALREERSKQRKDVAKLLRLPDDQHSVFQIDYLSGDSETPTAKKTKEAAEFLSPIVSNKNMREGSGKFYFSLKEESEDFRSCAAVAEREIQMGGVAKVDVHVHEICHIVEFQGTRSGADGIRGFLYSRSGGASLDKMADLFPGYGYKDDEVSIAAGLKVGDFDSSNRYASKWYNWYNTSEVLTMGVQEIYNDPVGFAKADPEYFRLIVGYLRGGYAR